MDRQRLGRTLSGFLAGRTTWPSVREFRDAGIYHARKAVNDLGGAERWAREFELEFPGGKHGSNRRWSDQAIKSELIEAVRGETLWPTREQFIERGLNRLHAAAKRHGGIQQWAREIGFTEWVTATGRPTRRTPY